VKSLLHILLSLFWSFLAFAVTGLATIAVELGIHGDEPFEHNPRAYEALGILILVIGLPVAIATFMFVLGFLHNREKAAAGRHRPRIMG
jgi:hypothetical protein